jgi:hypothetical protein
MPTTFGALVSAVWDQARSFSQVQSTQLNDARSALAAALNRSEESIRWDSQLVELFPVNRHRFAAWQKLGMLAPRLPQVELNPWIENIAIYGFLAALIAIAVPITQHLDQKEVTLPANALSDKLTGKALGLIVFASIIGVLMIPVYVVGRRYACRLPAQPRCLGILAQLMPQDNPVVSQWSIEVVESHLRDLVSRYLKIAADTIRDETRLLDGAEEPLRSTLVTEIHAGVESGLGSIPSNQRDDVYAVSFSIYNDDDDPRRPSLIIGFNTNEKWRDSIAQASSSDEAKWNYAFWLQNELLVIGRGEWTSRIEAWIDSLGLSYTDEDENADFDRCMELGAKITRSFISLACDVAAKLHATGTIVAVFGHPVPIIVHEYDYYDQSADQTDRANPSGLAGEFVSWVRGGCR